MYNWRVIIETWERKRIDNVFPTKNLAYKFYKENYNQSLSAQILHYNGLIWDIKKFYI